MKSKFNWWVLLAVVFVGFCVNHAALWLLERGEFGSGMALLFVFMIGGLILVIVKHFRLQREYWERERETLRRLPTDADRRAVLRKADALGSVALGEAAARPDYDAAIAAIADAKERLEEIL